MHGENCALKRRKWKRRWLRGKKWRGRYDDYLDTRHWANKRRAYLRRYPKCEVCGTTEDLRVHHKTYANLGQEPDRDLVTLCKQHHGLIHEYDVPKEVGHKLLIAEGEDKFKERPKKRKGEKRNVLKLRLDPELIRDKMGPELHEIIEREKAKKSNDKSK